MNQPLHTIGYEGSSIDDFLLTLKELRVELIIDVRDVPMSRKRGFSKNALSNHLAAQGIQYEHLKVLGDPKEGRIAARERRFDDFRRIYGDHLRSDLAQAGVDKAVSLASELRACLLCFERDHHECHRLAVAQEMAKRSPFRLVHAGVRQSGDRSARERLPHGDFAFVG